MGGVFLATWLAASLSFAQAQPVPVFRSGVDLVRVDVRVTDDNGRPIADLRPDEVQIKEEGAVRPVLLFRHVEAPRGTYTESAERTIVAQVSTNQGSPRGHVYVLVVDESHILPGREQRVRLAAERFLRAHVRPGDRVALYALPGPGPQIEFTADVARVLRELTAIRGMGEDTGSGTMGTMRTYEAYEIVRGNSEILERQATLVSQNLQASDTRPTSRRQNPLTDDPEDLRRTLVEDARSLVARRDAEARRFLVSLADLVRTLRRVDGRKAVILFSEGFQVDNVTHELEDVAAAAAQSYSVIYAMDLNPRSVEAADDTPRGGEQSTEILDKLQSLGSLTAETAGTLVSDASTQLDPALARIAETSEDYYLVGFTPAGNAQGDRSRYRRIQVIVTRPGVHVSARTGYAPNPNQTPADRRQTIDAALRAPFSQQGLRVEYTTYTLRGTAPERQRVIVALAAELPVASADSKPADVVYVVRDVETGKVAASGTDRIALPEAPRDGGATTGTGFYRVQFELPAGTYVMRAVVREPGGLLGSADRRFQVRRLDGPDVVASDLVLGSADAAGVPVRAAAYGSEMLMGVFEVYGRREAQLDALTATADLVPAGGGSTVLSTAVELQPVKPASDGVSRGARVEVPLAGVAPGEYLVRATVRNKGEAITELLRDVSVRAGTRPAAAATPFEPLNLLEGDVARRLVAAIQQARAHTTADDSTLQGLAAFAKADYPAAIAAFRAAESAGSPPRDNAALSFVLGWAYSAAGDDRAAVTAWRNAILVEPTLVAPYLALVETYVRLGHPDLARQVVSSGLRVLPRSPELLDRLARLDGR
jgi:VWFA-related protein